MIYSKGLFILRRCFAIEQHTRWVPSKDAWPVYKLLFLILSPTRRRGMEKGVIECLLYHHRIGWQFSPLPNSRGASDRLYPVGHCRVGRYYRGQWQCISTPAVRSIGIQWRPVKPARRPHNSTLRKLMSDCTKTRLPTTKRWCTMRNRWHTLADDRHPRRLDYSPGHCPKRPMLQIRNPA